MRRFLLYLLPAVVWSLAVLGASTDSFSSFNTGRWLSALLSLIFGHHPRDTSLDEMNFWWRKATHVMAYGTLGALWFRAVRAGSGVRWQPRWAWTALAITTSIATIDEIHQIFVPSRSASVFDVLLDAAGAALALGLIRLGQVLLFRS
jgi:VanZ family protein